MNDLLNAHWKKDVMTSDSQYRWSERLAATFSCLPVAPSVSLLPLASDLNLAQQDPAPVHPRNSFIHALNKPRWLPNIQHKHNSTAKFNSTAGLRDSICFSSSATAALSLQFNCCLPPTLKKILLVK